MMRLTRASRIMLACVLAAVAVLACPLLAAPNVATAAQPQVPVDPLANDVKGVYELLDKEQFERAEAAALELGRKYPNRPEPLYHLACVYSRWSKSISGDTERDEKLHKALESLTEAVRLGWVNLQHMDSDADMELLRRTPEYKELQNLIRRRIASSTTVDSAEPLKYELQWPNGTPRGTLTTLLVCHEHGSKPQTVKERFGPLCNERKWLLIALEGPLPVQERPDRLLGWNERSELRVLKTLRTVLADRTVGPRINRDAIIMAGIRQGAHVALNAGMVDPSAFAAVWTINSPVDAQTYEDARIKAVAGKLRVYDLHSTADTLGLAPAREAFEKMKKLGVDAVTAAVDAGSAPDTRLSEFIGAFDKWYERRD